MSERAVELFAGAPRATRLHTRLRWWWCPFPVIEAEVPKVGDVLEVGCGHGLLSLYLGLESPARRVVGVDIDSAKIAEAKEAAGRLRPGEADVSFEAVDPGYVPREYLGRDRDRRCAVPAAPSQTEQSLLDAAARALRPGGALVVKEMGLDAAVEADLEPAAGDPGDARVPRHGIDRHRAHVRRAGADGVLAGRRRARRDASSRRPRLSVAASPDRCEATDRLEQRVDIATRRCSRVATAAHHRLAVRTRTLRRGGGR